MSGNDPNQSASMRSGGRWELNPEAQQQLMGETFPALSKDSRKQVPSSDSADAHQLNQARFLDIPIVSVADALTLLAQI